MATTKFRDPSPFQVPRPQPPPEDYLFASYLDSVELDPAKHCVQKVPDVVNVALCGCGRAGSVHMGNLARNPRAQILYVVDDVEGKWEALRAFWALGEGTRFLHSRDSRLAIEDPRVDAVVVASPTHTHEALVRAALAAGKAVFCEKPIAGDIAGARRCYALAERAGRPLMCAFNRRFDVSFSDVRRRVREGQVGHVHVIKTCSRDSPMPSIEYLKISGGIFHDCAVHDIDLVLWILGELPSRAHAVASANIPEIAAIGDYDTVAIVLAFPSGTVAAIDLSRRACYGYDQRLEVFGPRGMVACQNERPTPGVERLGARGGRSHAPMWFSFPSRFRQAYAAEMEHFLDAVQDGASRRGPVIANAIQWTDTLPSLIKRWQRGVIRNSLHYRDPLAFLQACQVPFQLTLFDGLETQ